MYDFKQLKSVLIGHASKRYNLAFLSQNIGYGLTGLPTCNKQTNLTHLMVYRISTDFKSFIKKEH
jgi:hypothetical protein